MDGEELASSIAFVVFSQAFGPTIAMTFYNIIFLSSFETQLTQHAPEVNFADVIGAGATGFRSMVSPTNLDGVLVAYANSLDRIFYLAAALATSCGIFLWGMGWYDLRTKEEDTAKGKEGGPDTNQSIKVGEKAA